MNNQKAVLTTCEEEIVIITDTHTLNWLAVCLHFIQFCELRNLIDMDSTWLAFFSYTSDQSFLIICNDSLGKDNLGIKHILRILGVPYFFIISNHIRLKRTAWKINNRCEADISLVEIFFI